MRKVFVPVVAILLAALAVSACSPGSKPVTSITVAGSTSVQPFMELLAEEYARLYPDKPAVNVQGGGSSAGVQSVLSGAASLGMLSRKLAPEEQREGLHVVVMARDAIAVIVNPQNPISEMGVENLRKIYSGAITDWSQVPRLSSTKPSLKVAEGKPAKLHLSNSGESKKNNAANTAGLSGDPQGGQAGEISGNSKVDFKGKIHVISREEGSGTRGAFDELIMGGHEVTAKAIFQDSNGSVRQTVAQDPMAIGYISLGLVDQSVRPLAINGEMPTVENCKSGEYVLVRPFIVVFWDEVQPEAREYLDFITGQYSQEILAGEGLITEQTDQTEQTEGTEHTENDENPQEAENTDQQEAGQ